MYAESSSLTLTDSPAPISGELIDSLIESVVLPRDPRARSAVIYSLVQEICTTVEWLDAAEATPHHAAADEVRSIQQLATAARDHQRRMNPAEAHNNGGLR